MKKTNQAFTLIELLAVVVIIAIIATIGIYSITKIMNKSRMNSLTATALASKKAINNYLASNPEILDQGSTTIELFDSSDDNYINGLIELSKDPWGKDYQKVYGLVTFNGSTKQIDIVIQSNTGCFQLASDDDTIRESASCSFVFTGTPSKCFNIHVASKTLVKYKPDVAGCATGNIVNVDGNDYNTIDVSIPNGIEIIANSAFNIYNYKLTNVTIPGTVKYIARDSFENQYIENLVIPEGVEYVGAWAFNVNSLNTLTLPSTLKYIGYNAFSSNSLTSLTLPPNLEHIEYRAFARNPDLTSVVFPTNGAYIAPDTFEYCGEFGCASTVTVPANITHTTPDGCITMSNLGNIVSYNKAVCGPSVAAPGTVLNIPATIGGITVKGISTNAFVNWDGAEYAFTSVTMPDTIEHIQRGAFSYNKLTTLTLPSSLKFLDTRTFIAEYEQPGLTTIVFPSGLKYIGRDAFRDHNGLSNITVPSSIYAECNNPFTSDC